MYIAKLVVYLLDVALDWHLLHLLLFHLNFFLFFIVLLYVTEIVLKEFKVEVKPMDIHIHLMHILLHTLDPLFQFSNLLVTVLFDFILFIIDCA